MSASFIDGKHVSSLMREAVKKDVQDWISKGNRPPKLQVILIGDNPGSHTYVGAKTRACIEVGIESETLRLPDTVSDKELKQLIRNLITMMLRMAFLYNCRCLIILLHYQ